MRLLATPMSTDCFWNLYQLFPALWMRASARVCLGWTLVYVAISIVCAYVCRTLSMPHPGFFGPILSFFITALRHCPRAIHLCVHYSYDYIHIKLGWASAVSLMPPYKSIQIK